MNGSVFHGWTNESGQSMVESAFVFVILMFLLLGLVDFAYVFQDYIGVVNAANVGAVYGSTSAAAAANQTAIASAALSETDQWHCSNTSVSSSTSTDSYGYLMVSVTVQCQVADLIVIPNSIVSIQLSNTAVRRVR
jgi:Flp pilus assembly protein TadG